MSTATAVQLICPECQHENEAERIYCHDCGAKLDRSSLSARKVAQLENPEETHKRLQSMFSQRRARMRSLLLNGAKLTAASCVAAIVAQMFIPPDVPPPVQTATLPPQINLSLERLTQSRQPQLIQFSEDDVNAYLSNAFRSKKKKLSYSLLDFERAVVAFHEGSCRITIERSIFGYSFYTSESCEAQITGGKLTASTQGGAIGRLPIHPLLMRYGGFLFADAIRTMDREHKLLDRIGSMQIHEKQVQFASAQ